MMCYYYLFRALSQKKNLDQIVLNCVLYAVFLLGNIALVLQDQHTSYVNLLFAAQLRLRNYESRRSNRTDPLR